MVKKFTDLIARNKDIQAYSEFKEGVNEGLDIAKHAFEDNANTFYLSDLDEDQDIDRDIEIEELQNGYNLLIDKVKIKKKPGYSEELLEGIQEGLEKSKGLFGEFIKGFI